MRRMRRIVTTGAVVAGLMTTATAALAGVGTSPGIVDVDQSGVIVWAEETPSGIIMWAEEP